MVGLGFCLFGEFWLLSVKTDTVAAFLLTREFFVHLKHPDSCKDFSCCFSFNICHFVKLLSIQTVLLTELTSSPLFHACV